MNIAGTIDRPLTHDPKKQAPMKPSTSERTGSATPDFTTTGATEARQNRNREMQLMQEALARAHMHERLHDAAQERRAIRLATARRMQRRAERASMRARRALAMAVMQ
ncbi:hypothetical protein D9753_12115 [Streptomyces dangxiongensis]|uniref:Uncharacterized protein n=1 Tax=Streptomyces dangxiongensis TaxID=1442032 RepID=A0A3G2JFW8_9ACTN|nr:hypothetical protein [Streptomyces dangxiongensis]AYN39539.1 hypothetical protein D9753_12115 [Streptomyces dangxiongensis]